MTESGQLQPDETLDDRGLDDALDEGYSPPERLHGGAAVGVTEREQLEGETLEDRLRQEEPEDLGDDERLVPDADRVEEGFLEDGVGDREIDDPADLIAGGRRSGRLVAADRDGEHVPPARDVGIDGGAATAEEAAMHEIAEDEPGQDGN